MNQWLSTSLKRKAPKQSEICTEKETRIYASLEIILVITSVTCSVALLLYLLVYGWIDGKRAQFLWYFQHEGFCLTITFTMLVKYILLVYIKWYHNFARVHLIRYCECNYRNCYLHNLIQYEYTWPVLKVLAYVFTLFSTSSKIDN